MSDRLDTVVLLQEMKDRQRERARFNFQRVAVDSAMAVGLLAVGWLAVKLGLGVYELSELIQNPEAAVKGVLLAEQRVRIKELRKRMILSAEGLTPGSAGMRTGLAREGSIAARFLGAATIESEVEKLEEEIAEAEAMLAELEAEQAVEDEAQPTPGIKMLRGLDRFYTRYGPVAPVSIVGGNITMEILRIRRVRLI